MKHAFFIVIPRDDNIENLFPDAIVARLPAYDKEALVLKVPIELADQLEALLNELESKRKVDVIRLMVLKEMKFKNGERS